MRAVVKRAMATASPAIPSPTPSADDRAVHDAILDALAASNLDERLYKLYAALNSWRSNSESHQQPQLLVHVLKHVYNLETNGRWLKDSNDNHSWAPKRTEFEARLLEDSDRTDFLALKNICSLLGPTLLIAPLTREIVGTVSMEESQIYTWSLSETDFGGFSGVHIDVLKLGYCREMSAGGGQHYAEGISIMDGEVVQKDVWSQRVPETELQETAALELTAEFELLHR